MKKLKIIFSAAIICAVFGLSLTGCSSWFTPKAPAIQITRTYNLAYFNNLTITGPAKFIILSDKRQQELALTGTAENINKIAIISQARNLTINVPSNSHYNVTIYLKTGFLQNVHISSGVILQAQKLETLNLEVKSNNARDINISGQIIAAKTKIDQQSSGKISMAWLASDNVSLTATNGIIELAGQAYLMAACLSGSAYLDAKALRTNQLYINTYRSSRAHILPLDYLKTQTYEHSNVLYYHRPKDIDVDSQESSNALFINP